MLPHSRHIQVTIKGHTCYMCIYICTNYIDYACVKQTNIYIYVYIYVYMHVHVYIYMYIYNKDRHM